MTKTSSRSTMSSASSPFSIGQFINYPQSGTSMLDLDEFDLEHDLPERFSDTTFYKKIQNNCISPCSQATEHSKTTDLFENMETTQLLVNPLGGHMLRQKSSNNGLQSTLQKLFKRLNEHWKSTLLLPSPLIIRPSIEENLPN